MVTLQAVVLLAFADGLVHAFADLVEELNIPEDILKRTLHSLVCGKFKVLKRSDDASGAADKGGGGGGIKATESFEINDNFRYCVTL